MRKLQSQGVHHITITGADRQTSIDFWEGVLGMPFVFEQPNLDNASESHLYFDPGDGRLITIFTDEERTADPARTPIDPGCVHHVAFSLSHATFSQAVERLDERGIGHSGVKDRGFMDSIYFTDPLGLLIELASYRFEPPFGYAHADVLLEAHKIRVERGDRNIGEVHLAGCHRDSRHPVARVVVGRPVTQEPVLMSREEAMAEIKLHILKPSVNNLTARIFVRAAGLDFEEVDVWGQTQSPEWVKANPARLTPMLEEEGLPRATLWESCAIMQYLCNKHALEQLYPSDPAQRAMIDSAMFYLIGTLYPLVARATYPVLHFPQYPGEVGWSEADEASKAEAQAAAEAALGHPLEVYREFFMDGKRFIGGEHPVIADIRLAATLEFLDAIDYALPDWAREYMAAMESELGDAYAEPAADVRGYIASVKTPA
jgi:glutathione S-transferase